MARQFTPGESIPQEFNAVIEIPFGSSVKYELDKSSGLIKLDFASCTRRSIIPPITASCRRPAGIDESARRARALPGGTVVPLT